MTTNGQHYKQTRQWMRVGVGCVIGLFFLMRAGYGQHAPEISKQTTLLASIHVEPTNAAPGNHKSKIQPGTPVKLAVIVENKGAHPSAAGELYVRYAFAQPLDKEKNSLAFETEKESLPVIEPGQQVTVEFKTTHTLPAVFDFVRDDWSLREYQAIAVIDHEEKLLGTLALTFSAYYYPGIRKEFPASVNYKEPLHTTASAMH